MIKDSKLDFSDEVLEEFLTPILDWSDDKSEIGRKEMLNDLIRAWSPGIDGYNMAKKLEYYGWIGINADIVIKLHNLPFTPPEKTS